MSAIVAGGVAGLLAFLLAQGFTELSSRTAGGITSIFGKDKNGKPFKVSVQNEALVNPQFDIVELDSGVTTKKQRTAQFEIKNTSSTVKKIFAISIIPDAGMKTDGVIEVFLNESRLYPITDPSPGMLKGVSALNIPIPPNFGLRIDESKKLEVFVWTPNAVAVQTTFAVFIANQI